MPTLSVMDCATEGFRLIGRRPWAVVVWVLFWLLFGIAPLLLVFAGEAPKFLDLINALRDARGEHDVAALDRIVDFELGLAALIAPWGLWVVVVMTVLYAAVYRAVLEPSKGAFAYLRLGMDELRLFIALVGVILLATLLMIALTVLGAFIWGVSWRYIDQPWAALLDAVYVILALGLQLFVMLRLSFALPMTFAEKHIRVFESWRLTRRNFWPVLGLWAMTIVLIVALLLGFEFIRQLVFLIVGLSTGAFDRLDAIVTAGKGFRAIVEGLVSVFAPIMLALVVVQAIAQAIVRVIAVAPFARAYSQLSGRDTPALQES